jgi:intein-encoded DNA endonuclease-like protein
MTNLKNQTTLSLDPMRSPLKELDNFLLTAKTVAIIHYVFNQTHADMLADYIATWSQDEDLYENKSTVIVFVSDATLFNESIRRLSYQISIEPSTAEERKQILEEVAAKIKKWFEQHGTKTKLSVSQDIIQASSGLDLHSTETAASESFFLHRKFDVSAFTDYKVRILRTYNLEYVQPQIDFNMVGGYGTLKNYIRNRIITPLRNPEQAAYYGVGLPKGIILYGFPGTGKTYFSEALAKELGLAMVKLTPADLFRGIVGESESRVKQITTLIESLAPVVVMIDEKLNPEQISFSIMQELNADKARCIAWLSETSVYRTRYNNGRVRSSDIKLETPEENLANLFVIDFYNAYGYKATKSITKRGTFLVRVCLNLIADDLLYFAVKKKVHSGKYAFSLSSGYLSHPQRSRETDIAFLQRFFDCEGTVVKNERYVYVLATSISKKLVKDIQQMLALLDIKSSIIADKANWRRDREHRSVAYRIRINRLLSVRHFIDRVNFGLDRKRQKLLRLSSSSRPNCDSEGASVND